MKLCKHLPITAYLHEHPRRNHGHEETAGKDGIHYVDLVQVKDVHLPSADAWLLSVTLETNNCTHSITVSYNTCFI